MPRNQSRHHAVVSSQRRVAVFGNACDALILFVNGIYTAFVKFCVAATSFQVVHDENLPKNASIVLAISNPPVGCSV